MWIGQSVRPPSAEQRANQALDPAFGANAAEIVMLSERDHPLFQRRKCPAGSDEVDEVGRTADEEAG